MTAAKDSGGLNFRNIVGKTLMTLGLVGVVVFMTGMWRNYYLLAAAIAVVFAGGTDFGRQCPLILSVRHFVYRVRAK